MAPLRCLATEAARQQAPGLVLGQVWFQADDSTVLIANFVGHSAGLALIHTLQTAGGLK